MTTVSPFKFSAIMLTVTATLLSGCSTGSHITNIEPVSTGGSYQAEYRSPTSSSNRIIPASASMDVSHCKAEAPVSSSMHALPAGELLSPGDLVQIAVGNDETYSGNYEISSDGQLKVRGLKSVRAHGRSAIDVGNDVADALVSGGMYRTRPVVSVRLTDYGAARIYVAGAVFEPAAITLGGSGGSNIDAPREQASGAATQSRRISHALQNAGGVRPDADLAHVELKRGGQKTILDLRPALTGGKFDDVIVLEGDEISVPSRGCFQPNLVVPSVISPVGTKVFMSNLTESVGSNSGAGISKDTTELRYGSRMLQAIVALNCVGGSKLPNASRSAVLFSRNPETGKSIVIERNVEQLVRNGNRDDFNPFIMPGDALACYDSGTTDIVKLAQSLGIVAGAVVIGRGL